MPVGMPLLSPLLLLKGQSRKGSSQRPQHSPAKELAGLLLLLSHLVCCQFSSTSSSISNSTSKVPTLLSLLAPLGSNPAASPGSLVLKNTKPQTTAHKHNLSAAAASERLLRVTFSELLLCCRSMSCRRRSVLCQPPQQKQEQLELVGGTISWHCTHLTGSGTISSYSPWSLFTIVTGLCLLQPAQCNHVEYCHQEQQVRKPGWREEHICSVTCSEGLTRCVWCEARSLTQPKHDV